MKEVKQSVTETVTREETSYVCEEPNCDFFTVWKTAMKCHTAGHLKRKTCVVNGIKFIWFDSEHDADVWLDGQVNEEFHRNHFSSAGWYGIYHATESGYGGEDCYGIKLLGAVDIKNLWRCEKMDLEGKLAEINDGLAKIEELVT